MNKFIDFEVVQLLWAIISLLLILLIFSAINIKIIVMKDNNNDEVVIEFKALYGLIRYKKEYPLINLDVENKDVVLEVNEEIENNIVNNFKEKDKKIDIESAIEKIKNSMEVYSKYKKVMEYTTKKIKWKLLMWETEIGLEDAAVTGLAVGFLNIIKSNVLVFIKNNRYNFEKISLNAKPNFNTNMFNLTLSCIFSLKIGYIIIAGFKMIKIKVIEN